MLLLEKRAYQERVVQKTIKYFDRGVESVMVVSPTGSGKSLMGLAIAQALERKGLHTTWVAMRRNLLAQARRFNDDFFGVKNIEYVSMFSNDLSKTDFLITDEGHHTAAATCVHLVNEMQPRFHLGMSATPVRTDRLHLSFQKIVRDAGINVLIQQGFLAPYKLFVIPKWTPQSVAEAYARERERWGKSLIYFLTVEECLQCQTLLTGLGIRSEVVTAETDRERQLQAFEDREVDVLLNVFVLSEGFDCPDLRTVWVRPSSKCPTIQMGGRVFRKHPGKPFAQMVQSQNTHFSFKDLAAPLDEFVFDNGRWFSVKGNEDLLLAQQHALRVIATTEVTMPVFLQKRFNRFAFNHGLGHFGGPSRPGR